ncbi:MAG TPA: hypothetical protein VK425_09825, partial [Acidimicrobiales bacterium]|nr:hypothetical protein [Acidimicrobiales bacterium]
MKGTVRTPLPEPGTPLTEPSVDDDVAPEVAAPVPQRGRPSAALAVHGLTLAAAFSVWLYLDRKLWFFGDEWDFLTRRGLHGATFSIWAPHNEHWSVLPILLWRAIFSIAHLSAYWPYLVPLLLVHVAVVHLVWRRCLIEGVNIWVANAVALLLALFGTGAEDLAWAFQIGFLGSTALGLLALEVADARPGLAIGEAPGPTRLIVRRAVFDRPLLRDGLVSLLAVAALMCSDIGLAVCAALGLVLVARSGWARAARALAVPVGAYAIWFALAGHSGLASTGDTLGLSVFLKIPTFVATNLEMDLGHGVGWPAARYFLFAVVIAWLVLNARNLVRRHPAALAGAIAAVTFYALAAVGRDRISATMSPSRYAYVGIAFLLPSVALMLSSLPPALQGLRSRSWSRLRASHRRRTVLL